ncbi:MAG: hypothetical protein ACKOFE_08415 [Bacteroidota bacterium]
MSNLLINNRARSWAYSLTLVPGLITLWGNTMGGAWAWSNVVFVLGVVNSLEWIMGQRRNNEAVSESALPDLYVVLALPMVIAGILTCYGERTPGRWKVPRSWAPFCPPAFRADPWELLPRTK